MGDEMRTYARARVYFFSPGNGGRVCMPVGDGYAPYARVVGLKTDLPIRLNGFPEDGKFNAWLEVDVELTYHPEVDYSSLSIGTDFKLIEGPRIVGKGCVIPRREDDLQSKRLVEAIRLWAGRGMGPLPSRDEGRVVRHFGEADAADLLTTIKRLEDDFYASGAHLTATNLQEMEVLASEAFRRKHPSAAEEIVKTLAWCYTFDYK